MNAACNNRGEGDRGKERENLRRFKQGRAPNFDFNSLVPRDLRRLYPGTVGKVI